MKLSASRRRRYVRCATSARLAPPTLLTCQRHASRARAARGTGGCTTSVGPTIRRQTPSRRAPPQAGQACGGERGGEHGQRERRGGEGAAGELRGVGERARGRSRPAASSSTGPSSASARQSASAAQAAAVALRDQRRRARARCRRAPTRRGPGQRGAEQARELPGVAGLGGVGDAGGEAGDGEQQAGAGERDRGVAERPARARDRGGEQRLGAAAGLLAAQAQHGLDRVGGGDQREDPNVAAR